MRIGIIGAGAIGTWLAARLAESGQDVSVLARGNTLQNLKKHGARVKLAEREIKAEVNASDKAQELGPQDVVIFAVKSQSLAGAAKAGISMIGKTTLIMPAMNGVPWWFLDGAGSNFKGQTLTSVDPHGICSDIMPLDQVLGCVVHASTFNIEPGYVQHVMGDGIIIGAANAATKDKVKSVTAIFSKAGFAAKISENIRQDIWYKLWGNMTMNPISAITGATCDLILDDPGSNAFATAIMNEAAAIGKKIQCPINDSPKARNDITRKLGAFKTSMLQDAEAGRPLEIDALLAAPQEIARKIGINTPALDHLLGIMRVFEKAQHG